MDIFASNILAVITSDVKNIGKAHVSKYFRAELTGSTCYDDEDSTATVLQQRDPLTLKRVEQWSEGITVTTKMKTALLVLQQQMQLLL